MEKALLEAMIREVKEGRRADSGYKKQSWDAARAAVMAVDPIYQAIQVSHCKTKHNNFKRDWKIWAELTSQSGFSVDEHGVVTENARAIDIYFEAHPEARRFRAIPMKFRDLAQMLFDGVLATGQYAMTIESLLISDSIERDMSTPPASPLKRAGTESASSQKKRLALDRLGDQFGELSYQLSRQNDHNDAMREALLNKSDVRQDAIKSFHKQFGILPIKVKLMVLEAFSNDFSAKNFLLLPLEMKKAWTEEQVYHNCAALEAKGINVRKVMCAIEWEREGDTRQKVAAGDVYRTYSSSCSILWPE